jgi:hypothetical protein
LIELLVCLAVAATLVGIGIPAAAYALDELRTALAARYIAARIAHARLDAVQRSTRIGLRFEPSAGDYAFTVYADGNRNGVRTTEIVGGVDAPMSVAERLADQFAGVQFGLAAGVPDLDGHRASEETDGVRIGSPRILTLGPDGTATSGTLYIRGRRGQFAVRVLGATARTRIFKYHAGADAWTAR